MPTQRDKGVPGAMSFAHLAGLPNGPKASADDDEDREQRDGESDEDYKARLKAMDDDEDPKKDDAESDDEDPKAADDDDKPKGGKAKKAKADDQDPDDDDKEELNGKSSASKARLRERERCAAIFGSKHAAGKVELACSLAFDTSLTRKEAIAVLAKTPAAAPARGGAPASRSERNPNLADNSGGDMSANSQKATVTSWDRSMQRARGIKK